MYIEIDKNCTMFLSRYRNKTGSLGEREMLWEHELQAVLSNFQECLYNLIETWKTWFLFLLEKTTTKEKNNLLTLIIKMRIVLARTILTSIAHASSVFLLSCIVVIFTIRHTITSYYKFNYVSNDTLH